MNSREYRFIFALKTQADVPSDFQIPPEARSFDGGIFLPQDDKKWWTEVPSYPARILLLADQRFHLISHPGAAEGPVQLDLDEIVQFETGVSLLRGWIQFQTEVAVHRVLYNTRDSDELRHFLSTFRRQWLKPQNRIGRLDVRQSVGPEADIKFKNMLRDALDHQEQVLSQLVVPPLEHRKDYLFIKRIHCSPGHLVALTTNSRLLWLHDSYRGRQDFYSSISVSAPLSMLASIGFEIAAGQKMLVLSFTAGTCWKIPAISGLSECEAFQQTLRGYLDPLSKVASVY